MTFASLACVSPVCLLKGYLSLDLGPIQVTQDDLIAIHLIASATTLFPNRLHSQVLGVRTWTYLCGATIQSTTLSLSPDEAEAVVTSDP